MLARCYRWAFIAYVGQDPAGNLHNVLEPAAYGVPVLFKYHAKHAKCFPESQYLIVNNAAQSVQDADDLLQAIGAWTQNPPLHKQASQAASQAITRQLGATARTTAVMKNYLSH